ncbi:ATP adenylyltransferase family protein [Thiohalorhabdus sp.]|uniref:ATP adenylyltransferase family protein n=1 Tax=Thiohalorhabdus sp. TaxID=3094134 RepID=UPI002FC30F3F
MPDPLPPGTLWGRIRERTAHALETGALKPIPTECELVPNAGVDFQVRIAPNLSEKIREVREQKEREAAGENADPLSDPEPDLWVGDLSPTHFGLLNKFPVLEHHLLLVTLDYEDQEAPLTEADFDALHRALTEMDGLAFYNAGKTAGASQGHKHLQVVPLPLGTEHPRPPMEELLLSPELGRAAGTSSHLPFPHTACRLDFATADGRTLLGRYKSLRQVLGLSKGETPYNLLVTRDWMMLVPRTRERFQGIMINALGFAGGFLVRDRDDLDHLRQTGPMRVLQGVTGAIREQGA